MYKRGTTISQRMGSIISRQIEANHLYLKTIAEILLLCSKQEIPLCDNDESRNSLIKRGNFLEILDLVANHYPVIRHRLTNGPNNATYTSAENYSM